MRPTMPGPYADGWDAFDNGDARDANPFRGRWEVSRFAEWDLGWSDAKGTADLQANPIDADPCADHPGTARCSHLHPTPRDPMRERFHADA